MKQPTLILQEKLGSISWKENVQGLRKVKHVGLKYYFSEAVAGMHVLVQHKPSDENRADGLRKFMIGELFNMVVVQPGKCANLFPMTTKNNLLCLGHHSMYAEQQPRRARGGVMWLDERAYIHDIISVA